MSERRGLDPELFLPDRPDAINQEPPAPDIARPADLHQQLTPRQHRDYGILTAAKAARRLLWERDRLPEENPAAFTWRAYQAEARAGTLHRGVIGQEDPPLRLKLKNWLRTHPMPEGVDIPTKPEWNTRRLAIFRDDPTAREALRLDRVARERRRREATGASTLPKEWRADDSRDQKDILGRAPPSPG